MGRKKESTRVSSSGAFLFVRGQGNFGKEFKRGRFGIKGKLKGVGKFWGQGLAANSRKKLKGVGWFKGQGSTGKNRGQGRIALIKIGGRVVVVIIIRGQDSRKNIGGRQDSSSNNNSKGQVVSQSSWLEQLNRQSAEQSKQVAVLEKSWIEGLSRPVVCLT